MKTKKIDLKKIFDEFVSGCDLNIKLSFDMPEGYENANGTYDFEKRTLFYNSRMLSESDDYEQVFYLFHELRHALQYERPEEFSEEIRKSLPYIVMYNGQCCKLVGGKYIECTLDGEETYFTELYLNTPYEIDANEYAAEKCRELFPEKTDAIKELLEWWLPKNKLPFPELEKVYARIDAAIGENK